MKRPIQSLTCRGNPIVSRLSAFIIWARCSSAFLLVLGTSACGNLPNDKRREQREQREASIANLDRMVFVDPP